MKKNRRPKGYLPFEKNLRLFILECLSVYTKRYTLKEIQINPNYKKICKFDGISIVSVKIIINNINIGWFNFSIGMYRFESDWSSWLTKKLMLNKLRKFTTCKLRKI